MKDYYIYLEKNESKELGPYTCRRYYAKKLKKPSDKLTFCGKASLTKDFFIVGSETHHTEITDLNDVSLEFTAVLSNKRLSKFEFTVQELLERAKEGILPYISFNGHKVAKRPIIKIHGKKTSTKYKLDI